MANQTEAAEQAKILSETAANLRRQAEDLIRESERLRQIARNLRKKRSSKPPAR